MQSRTKKRDEVGDQASGQTYANNDAGEYRPLAGSYFFELSRAVGNRAVSGLLNRNGDRPQVELDSGIGIAPGLKIQTKRENGGSNAREEREADRAADAATRPPEGPKISRALIVEDDSTQIEGGQMTKSEFLGELHTSVCSAAEEALAGTIWSAAGCPFIDRWFSHYSGKSSQHLERALLKYAPQAAGVTTARGYIPIITERVRRGIEEWRETGEVSGVPEEVAQGGMPGVTAGSLLGGLVGGAVSAIGSAISGLASGIGRAVSGLGRMLFKKREGGSNDGGDAADPAVIKGQLGSGQALEGGARSRMESAYGVSFSGVRVHTDSRAQQVSDGLGARAFTVGSDVAFGAGEYQPGTLIGDALIAHELAHVQQQSSGASASAMAKGDSRANHLEDEADAAAVGAMVSAAGGLKARLSDIAGNMMPRLKSGLRLQRCSKYVTNKGSGVTTLSSGAPPFEPDVTVADANAQLSALGLLTHVTQLAPPSNSYDCHGYTFLGGKAWINDDEVDSILADNGYTVTTSPVVGDIVIYRSGGSIKHSGVITAVAGTSVTQVQSKWGRLGLYRHAPGDVPPTYGGWTAYHTDRPGGHELRERK